MKSGVIRRKIFRLFWTWLSVMVVTMNLALPSAAQTQPSTTLQYSFPGSDVSAFREVHTRGAAGQWKPDTQGLVGSIPNDEGYSFFYSPSTLSRQTFKVSSTFTFVQSVDYNGAGVGVFDLPAPGPNFTNLRCELSLRQNHVVVTGWLNSGEGGFPSGVAKPAGKQLAIGTSYTLTLDVQGTTASCLLDGQQVVSATITELAKFPDQIHPALFLIEANIRFASLTASVTGGTVSATPPSTAGPAGVQVAISAYGKDETDGSDVGWNSQYPNPSFDDDPNRKGLPNARWQGSYYWQGSQLCLAVKGLEAPYPPANTLAIGYTVSLQGATFEDGPAKKTFVLYRFSGTPAQKEFSQCYGVRTGAATTPPGGAVSLAWTDFGMDRVGSGSNPNPDGTGDGRFKVSLNVTGTKTVSVITLYSSDDKGNPAAGQVWNTAPDGYWILGVYRDGKRLNPQDTTLSDPVSGQITYELFANNSGYFKPGQYFGVTIRFTDNTEVKATTSVASVATPAPAPAPIPTPVATSIPAPAPGATDTILRAEERTSGPNSTVTVPLRMEKANRLGSLNFSLRYDAAVVKVNKVEAGDLVQGTLFQASTREAGIIRFGIAVQGASGVSGDGPVANIEFSAIGTNGSRSPLTLGDIVATDSGGAPIGLNTRAGAVAIGGRIKGDYDGDGRITVKDALAALKMSIRELSQDLNLDIDNNSQVTAEDARRILSMALGSEPVVSPPFPSSGGPTPGVVTTSGGTIEAGGIKVVFPQGSLDRDQKVSIEPISNPPLPANLNQRIVSSAFAVQAGQPVFSKTITVTLSIDKAKLPPGARNEDVYPALAMGDVYERLRPDKVDLEKGEVVFTVDRTVPFISLQGAPVPAPDYFVVAADIDRMVELKKTDRYQFLAPDRGGLKEKAQTLVEPAEKQLDEIRTMFAGFSHPGFIYVYLVPAKRGYTLFVTGVNTITINLDDWATGDFPNPGIAHEYFHLIQGVAREANLKKLREGGIPMPPDLNSGNWAGEATADFMAMKAYPNEVSGKWKHKTFNLPLDYTYKSLLMFEWPLPANRLGHQYETFVFFSFLDSLYDGVGIVRQIYTYFLSNNDPLTGEAKREAVWDMRDILDKVLSKTPDKRGMKRSLPEVFAEFLVSYNYWKNFEPLKSNMDENKLGKTGGIKLPDTYLEGWNIPDDAGGQRINIKSSRVKGEKFSIVKAFSISSMTSEKAGEKGDLELRLQVGDSDRDKKVAMIVFPFKDKITDDFSVGNPTSPVVIKSWENYGGALVWLVDATPQGQVEMELRAEFKKTVTPQVSVYRLKGASVTRFQLTDGNQWTAVPELTTNGATWSFATPAEGAATEKLALTWTVPQTIETGKDVVITVTPSATITPSKELSYMASISGGFSVSSALGRDWIPLEWKRATENYSTTGEVTGKVTCKTVQGTQQCSSGIFNPRAVASFQKIPADSVRAESWPVTMWEVSHTLPAVARIVPGTEITLIMQVQAVLDTSGRDPQKPNCCFWKSTYKGKIEWTYRVE